MNDLLSRAERLALLLKDRRETVAVAESSAGGLVSAALLAVPGASAYFLGGAVVYTYASREVFLDLPQTVLGEIRPATEADLDHAIGLMTKHRAIEDTVQRARHYGAIARDALALFPDSAMKQALEETVEFTIARTH